MEELKEIQKILEKKMDRDSTSIIIKYITYKCKDCKKILNEEDHYNMKMDNTYYCKEDYYKFVIKTILNKRFDIKISSI